ncbi:hypothetical protein C8D88_107411 [Lentzea atacamensis]|uniref:Uncharacterized protein n=1 Tax=Lentzea atacamensis TaxID=531938 RepID=A0A316HX16_9PSEU|nr:hypothetical protein C8D88_107411 [Lentzea atacamensis]
MLSDVDDRVIVEALQPSIPLTGGSIDLATLEIA